MGNRIFYNIKNILSYSIPKRFFRMNKDKILVNAYKKYCSDELLDRVNYYCKLKEGSCLSEFTKLKDHKLTTKLTTYFFDSYEITRYFDDDLKWKLEKGDVNYFLKSPSIAKSRPVDSQNYNLTLLNLDKIRHFNFIQDTYKYGDKLNMLIFRGKCYQEHRVRFLKMYFDHPMCNLGDNNKENKDKNIYYKPRISIKDHLKYKFILSLEGNDVATNLKWIMSSNSIVVMPKPKFETFFMEGRLQKDTHYIEIKDDYSDLEYKLNYFLKHQNEALEIIKNANKYVQQFKNKEKEKIISILVLEKYFHATNQIQSIFHF